MADRLSNAQKLLKQRKTKVNAAAAAVKKNDAVATTKVVPKPTVATPTDAAPKLTEAAPNLTKTLPSDANDNSGGSSCSDSDDDDDRPIKFIGEPKKRTAGDRSDSDDDTPIPPKKKLTEASSSSASLATPQQTAASPPLQQQTAASPPMQQQAVASPPQQTLASLPQQTVASPPQQTVASPPQQTAASPWQMDIDRQTKLVARLENEVEVQQRALENARAKLDAARDQLKVFSRQAGDAEPKQESDNHDIITAILQPHHSDLSTTTSPELAAFFQANSDHQGSLFTEDDYVSDRKGEALVGTMGTGIDDAVRMLLKATPLPRFVKIKINKAKTVNLSSLELDASQKLLIVHLHFKPINKTTRDMVQKAMECTASALKIFIKNVGGSERPRWDQIVSVDPPIFSGDIVFDNANHQYQHKRITGAGRHKISSDDILMLKTYASQRVGIDIKYSKNITFKDNKNQTFQMDGTGEKSFVIIPPNFMRRSALKKVINALMFAIVRIYAAARVNGSPSWLDSIDEAAAYGIRVEDELFH